MVFIDKYEFPAELWYDAGEHLWVRAPVDGEAITVTVGVDAVGEDALGDVTGVELVDPGVSVQRGDPVGSLVAQRTVRPVFAPVAGTLIEVNREVMTAPRLLNIEPYGRGWLFRLRCEAWRSERQPLLHDEMAVMAWIRGELRAHEA